MTLKLYAYICITLFSGLSITSQGFTQQLAFPGAEGFGAYAEGGRGGDVYYVTNLNDDGAGSLRYGIDNASGPRTIVFAVSGTIALNDDLKVDKDYITIAGQTAPGDGICLRNDRFKIEGSHVIVRYIRSRLGDVGGVQSAHPLLFDFVITGGSGLTVITGTVIVGNTIGCELANTSFVIRFGNPDKSSAVTKINIVLE